MELDQDFKEFIELLNKHEVEYLLIGGFAVALHGYVRNTVDIDFWINNSKINAEKLVRVMDDFGFHSLQLKSSDFEKENVIIQLGYPPHRIDLITSPEGVVFEECYPKRLTTITTDGINIHYVDLGNLKKNKKAAGRSQDIADIDHLP
ncbi:MAG: hypothetical protein KBF97_03650 [Bacteroidetes bacterium]|nr:hypothetical protein [Bacteroidota bacterium]